MRKSATILVLLVVTIVSASVGYAQQPTQNIDRNTLVSYAIDVTADSECTYGDNIPCSEGSVIRSDITTYGDAVDKGYEDFVVLSGDDKKDDDSRINLHKKVHDKKKTKKEKNGYVSINSCTGGVSATGSFLASSQGPRVSYYVVGFLPISCSLINLGDKALVSLAGTSVYWFKSCFANNIAGFQCVDRSPAILLSTNYTALQSIPLFNVYKGSDYYMYSRMGTIIQSGMYPGFGN